MPLSRARAQEMAAHESPPTTRLCNRTKKRLTRDEVERSSLRTCYFPLDDGTAPLLDVPKLFM